MATINDLVLPYNTILVLPDEGSDMTGVIFRRSPMGGGVFKVAYGGVGGSNKVYDHILFTKELATEVTIDEVEYLAMHANAVVGLIP